MAWPPALSAYTRLALLGITPELLDELEELEELDELDELEELEELDELDVLEDELVEEDELLEPDAELLEAGVPLQPNSADTIKAAPTCTVNLRVFILWTPNYCF